MLTFIRAHWALAACVALTTSCSGAAVDPVRATENHRTAAQPAITALQQGSFERADALAVTDLDNPYARLVHAVVRYKKAMQQLAVDGRTIVVGGFEAGSINQKYLRTTVGDAESELAAVEADLSMVAKHRGIAVELCLACWDIDWNANGRIDDRDKRLLEIEEDENGKDIPEGDPRRRPTFRFDDGDIAWARAFVSFERAALDVVLAYDWSEVAALGRRRSERPSKIVVRLVAPERIAAARQRILEGLDHSDATRRAYLEETDDDREWVPSPRQKSHPMPLAVDQALYDTWEGVVGDVRRMVRGDEGLFVADVLALTGERPPRAPLGYLNIGSMLSRPKDIVLDLDALKRLDREDDIEGALTQVLGDHYVRSMPASPLPKRLLRMKGEIEHGDRELGRKLRYLFWLN